MSKETFEEWFKSEGQGDFNSFSKDYYAGQWAPLIKHTWNHCHKEIDQLRFDKAKMREEYKALDRLYNEQSDRQLDIANRYWKRCEEIIELKDKIKELKEELEREHKQVHDMCEQLALLTECIYKDSLGVCDPDRVEKCSRCDNLALLEKERGE